MELVVYGSEVVSDLSRGLEVRGSLKSTCQKRSVSAPRFHDKVDTRCRVEQGVGKLALQQNLESDDEGVELGAELLGGLGLDEVALGHGGDEGRVEAAGEEDTEGHVGHEPLDHRLGMEQRAKHMARSVSCQ